MFQQIAKSLQLVSILILLSGCATATQDEVSSSNERSGYPVTIENCGEPVTFESAPERSLAFDTNMTEIMLELGLEDSMVGYWVSGVQIKDKYSEQLEGIPLLSEETWPPPGMEILLDYDPDFVFGAWDYNFSEESGVTPERLEELGVKSYALKESCVATGMQPNATLDSTYEDITTLGVIFGVEDRAKAVVDEMKANIQDVQETIGEVDTSMRGFYYGGGADTAFTAGKYAMASKLMAAVGAENIFSDVEDDWIPSAGWEAIIERDPEFILIDDTPWESADQRIATLKSLPQLEGVTAIRDEKFIVLPWTYILPSVDMDKGVRMLAESLYPDLFE